MAICAYIKNQDHLGLKVQFSGRAPACHTQGQGLDLQYGKEKRTQINNVIMYLTVLGRY
jgi:hypothetical protein